MHDLRLAGGSRIRIGPWRGESSTAMLSPYMGPALDAAVIAHTLEQLVKRGYTHVHTAAIADHDVPTFEASGFSVKRRLHLLSRSLDRASLRMAPGSGGSAGSATSSSTSSSTRVDGPRADAKNGASLRTARRWDRAEVLAADRAAFDDFWAFDNVSLDDAASATPSSRTRITRTKPVQGYALAGVAGTVGYLQRLAVVPDAAGQGLGTTLLFDALRWMRRRGASLAYVNTQVENERALQLYLRSGFRQQPQGLTILERSLTS